VLGLAVPATASAATLTVSGGTLAFQAAPGETNVVDVHDIFDPVRGPGLTISDAGAPLTADPSCDAGPPLLCATAPVTMHLGDRSDTASVISIENDASVWGDDGDDDILASGITTLAFGGSGHDHVRVNSNGDATAHGGTGNDTIEAASSFRALGYGDSGNDLLVQGRSITAILDGGSGSDVVIGLARASGTVEGQGGTGTDVLAVQSTGGSGPIADWTLGGGDGDDVIAGGLGADTISGGAGRDRIYAADGGADTVRCGSGYDVVRADTDDTVAADCESVRISSVSSVPAAVSRARRRAAALSAR
jgi:Ca2+-binding RTX toxin-like protein